MFLQWNRRCQQSTQTPCRLCLKKLPRVSNDGRQFRCRKYSFLDYMNHNDLTALQALSQLTPTAIAALTQLAATGFSGLNSFSGRSPLITNLGTHSNLLGSRSGLQSNTAPLNPSTMSMDQYANASTLFYFVSIEDGIEYNSLRFSLFRFERCWYEFFQLFTSFFIEQC